MHAIDVMDETYIAAPPHTLVPRLADEQVWHRALGLRLRCYEDRGVLGKRWRLQGHFTGTCEVWFEELAEGTIVHAFIRADRLDQGNADQTRVKLHRAWKRLVFEVKREFDDVRAPGVAPGG